jgi:hypothetical protein
LSSLIGAKATSGSVVTVTPDTIGVLALVGSAELFTLIVMLFTASLRRHIDAPTFRFEAASGSRFQPARRLLEIVSERMLASSNKTNYFNYNFNLIF